MDAVQATEVLRRLRPVQRLARFFSDMTAFLTGGTVRDALLGLPVGELDIAIAGDAAACAHQLADQLGGTAFPLGREPLVTYRVVARGLRVDLWSVAGSLEEDILRRDFTVNALFFRLPSGPLFDLVGGLAHLAAGKLEVVRPDNLAADPLRVLRGLRLSLTHPLALTSRAATLLKGAAPGLSRVAKERIREEVGKILQRAPLAAAWQRGLALGIWHALGVAPGEGAADPEPVLERLDRLRRRRGVWGEAAADVSWLALAAARLAAGEDAHQAVPASLKAVGLAGNKLTRLVRVASLVSDLLAGPPVKTVLACTPPNRSVLAWWYACNAEASWPRVLALWRWWVGFSRTPPLLPSEEVVALLGLPPGPERAAAIARLRQLQALGTIRSAARARQFLRKSTAASG